MRLKRKVGTYSGTDDVSFQKLVLFFYGTHYASFLIIPHQGNTVFAYLKQQSFRDM
jgi:hypothetical protein